MPIQVATDLPANLLLHRGGPGVEAIQYQVWAQLHPDPVDIPPPVARQIERTLAKCLGRDATAVDRGATRPWGTIDDRDLVTEVCRLGGRFLASGTGADGDHLEVIHASPWLPA